MSDFKNKMISCLKKKNINSLKIYDDESEDTFHEGLNGQRKKYEG